MFLIIAFISVIFAGCSHTMRITNIEDYFVAPSSPLKEPIKLGITSVSSTDPENSRYISAIVDALVKTGNFERVIYPYSQALHKDITNVVADINVKPNYSGRGSNFLINWPGFLIFAPAIWGYGYEAKIETVANITNMKDGRSQQIAVPMEFKFRHADIGRTWTVGVGWIEVGITPLIGGILFTDYDPNATAPFITNVSTGYGAFVAKKIVEAL